MIALVRHPAVNAHGRCYGRLDLELANPAAAASLAARLAPLGGTVWTSPARRCRCVAEALGAHWVDDRLQELDFGEWEGLAWDDVPRASLDEWAANPWGFAPPNGETGAALVSRVSTFAAQCEEGDHIVITHGGPLKVLTAVLRNEAVCLLASAPPPGSIQIVQAAR